MKQSNWILTLGIIVALLLITGSFFVHPNEPRQSASKNQENYRETGSLGRQLTTGTLIKLHEWISRYGRRL